MITDILFGLSEYGMRQVRIAIVRQARRDRKLRGEWIKAIREFNRDMEAYYLRDMEAYARQINPQNDLIDLQSDVHEKDIALAVNESDEDLPF